MFTDLCSTDLAPAFVPCLSTVLTKSTVRLKFTFCLSNLTGWLVLDTGWERYSLERLAGGRSSEIVALNKMNSIVNV